MGRMRDLGSRITKAGIIEEARKVGRNRLERQRTKAPDYRPTDREVKEARERWHHHKTEI